MAVGIGSVPTSRVPVAGVTGSTETGAFSFLSLRGGAGRPPALTGSGCQRLGPEEEEDVAVAPSFSFLAKAEAMSSQ